MPLIKSSTFPKPPFYLFNGHLETFYSPLFRKVKGVTYKRERFTLSDGDFIDLDWVKNDQDKLIILTHGLEGNSDRHYIKGMAKLFGSKGYDILAWNCRSCSGEMNLKLRLYNHGEISDIGELIDYALENERYKTVVLAGFSMGGSISLKYLGVKGKNVPSQIKAGIAFSTPVDLHTSVALLDEPQSKVYRNRFMKMLRPKIEYKAHKFPGVLDLNNFNKIKKWEDFDNYFSAPLNGYKNATDFYTQASCINYIEGIQVPTLLVNSLNDPILTPQCFPYEMAKSHHYLHFEAPAYGGHVAYHVPRQEHSWAEYRSLEFVNEVLES